MVIDVREEQPRNAELAITLIFSGIVTDVTFGLQSMTASFLIKTPSISISAIFAPQ